MNASVLTLLRCPVCRGELRYGDDGRSVFCTGEKKHCFDLSKSGYLNLAGPHGGEGDLKESVRSRKAFLDGGFYRPLTDAVLAKLDAMHAKTVLDAGCGEGYYTNCFAKDGRAVLGIDLSKCGIDVAAKRAKAQQTDAAFAVAGIFELPVADESMDAVVNLFAPCAEAEFSRVLRPGGALLVAGAGERHLWGLKEALYDTPYVNQARADLPVGLELLSRERLHYEFTVEGNEQLMALFSMTPYYWRTAEKDRQKLQRLERLTTEADFDLFLYKKGSDL